MGEVYYSTYHDQYFVVREWHEDDTVTAALLGDDHWTTMHASYLTPAEPRECARCGREYVGPHCPGAWEFGHGDA